MIDFFLNRLNFEVRGTLMNMIVKNHPNVKYHEIDVTNPETLESFTEFADQFNLNLNSLNSGPQVIILYNRMGITYKPDHGGLEMLTVIDRRIHETETRVFMKTNSPCNVETELMKVDRFENQHSEVDDIQPDQSTKTKKWDDELVKAVYIDYHKKKSEAIYAKNVYSSESISKITPAPTKLSAVSSLLNGY